MDSVHVSTIAAMQIYNYMYRVMTYDIQYVYMYSPKFFLCLL